MTGVSIVRCVDYEPERVKESILNSLELIGGIEKIVKTGDNVLLKVNIIVGFPPERAATTHPSVVQAMVEIVKEAGGIPWVGDSSGAYGYTAKSLEMSGIRKATEDAGGKLINFEPTGAYQVEVDGKVLTSVNIAKPVMDCDVLVSLPKLKTHMMTKYTGAVKNFYGAIPGSGKAAIHRIAATEESFSNAVIDIYSVLKPKLAVMDGIVGMEMYYKLPEFLGKFIFKRAENISKVEISEDECKKCQVCLDSCPASAITLEHEPSIDREKCIKCYCCHELCMKGAVKLKTSYLGRQLLKGFLYES